MIFAPAHRRKKNSVPENMGPSGVSRSGLILSFIRVYPR
jgi:hypothetical protein